MFNNVNPAKAHAAVEAGEAVLVDVRRKDEWRAGRSPLATHLALESLPNRSDRLKGQTVYVVCRSGNRSARAARFLRGAGIEAYNVSGGMGRWKRLGLAVVDHKGKPGSVI